MVGNGRSGDDVRDSGDVVLYPSKPKMALLLLGTLALVAACVLLLFDDAMFRRVAGVLGILLFGAAGCFAVVRMLRSHPILVVGDAGITDRTSMASVGFLDWQEIEQIGRYSMWGQRFLTITVRDPDALRARMNGRGRMTMRGNLKTTGAHLTIPLSMLSIRRDTLEREITARWAQRQERPESPNEAG